MNDANAVVKEQAPLDELMLAMDVVDTLRHKELVLTREVEAEDREADLLNRLREIYTSQGIVVTDEILAQGVKALHEERFVYRPPPATFGRTLAVAYVTRGRWGKWVGGLTATLAVAALVFQLTVRGPEQRALAELPVDLQGAYQGVVVSTENADVLGDARALLTAGEAAVAQREFDAARTAVTDLRTLADRLQVQYELRIVSRPGEQSGVWRVPDANPRGRNYYLIVEAVTPDGQALRLPIKSEEDGRTRAVRAWGLRVDQATFERVAADQRDDGIIQDTVVGAKRRGELDAQYTVPATGAAITEW
jgi:hypothetical protein